MSQLILVVDDDGGVRTGLGRLLRAHGYRVVVVGDADSAVTAAETARPAVILLDLHMPKRSGVDLARELRQHAELAATPLVAISATPPHDPETIALFDRVLEKPCPATELITALESLVSP